MLSKNPAILSGALNQATALGLSLIVYSGSAKALIQMGILGFPSHENPSHIFLKVSPLKRLPGTPVLYKQVGETPRSREIYFGSKSGVDI